VLTAPDEILRSLETIFAGRRVALVCRGVRLPAARGWSMSHFVTLGRGLVILASVAVVVAIGYFVGQAFGSSVGVIAAVILSPVVVMVAVTMFRRESADAMRLRAPDGPCRDDWVLPLIPGVGVWGADLLDPRRYVRLLDRGDRPVLVLDRGTLLHDARLGPPMGPLVPSGRFPEPEVLAVSKLPAGASLGSGISALACTPQFLQPLYASLLLGVQWEGRAILGLVLVVVAAFLILRDPKTRRWIGLGWLGPTIVVGPGWLRDARGNVFTVADSVLIVEFDGCVRCVRRDVVVKFYLSCGVRPDRASSAAHKGRFRRALDVALRSVGIGAEDPPAEDMPTGGDPLRLLLSSWTYPEPRPDLAMRD